MGLSQKNCVLTINEEEAQVVRQIFDLYANQKMGIRRISQQLYDEGYTSRKGNAFNVLTIRHILQNPKYKGWYCANKSQTVDYRSKRKIFLDESEWVMYPDPSIPAIVSEELWDRANALYKQRSSQMMSHQSGAEFHNRYPYSGKIICEEHGTSFHRHVHKSKRRGKVECWNCKLYRQKGKEGGCNSPTMYSSELDRVLAKVFERVTDEKSSAMQEYIRELKDFAEQQDHSAELETLEGQISALADKKEKLLELTLDGALSNAEFKKRNEQYNEKIKDLEERCSGLKNAGRALAERIRRVEKLSKTIEQQWNANCGFSREMSRALVDHIVVDADETNTKIYLDIVLTLDKEYHAAYTRPKKKNNVLSFEEIHISQAQVSRLEKGALDHIRKRI